MFIFGVCYISQNTLEKVFNHVISNSKNTWASFSFSVSLYIYRITFSQQTFLLWTKANIYSLLWDLRHHAFSKIYVRAWSRDRYLSLVKIWKIPYSISCSLLYNKTSSFPSSVRTINVPHGLHAQFKMVTVLSFRRQTAWVDGTKTVSVLQQ